MPTRASAPDHHATAIPDRCDGGARSSAVLDHVAERVRQRLAAERSAVTRTGEGGHAASLIRTWPL
ncbi:HaaA family cyclophane-containing RiPP peptide [Streptomyces sp. NPDC003023]|uniref:HaaA family cyclophane-containing RiPP peptide n=1 Tax=Streptomyces sp. NPDC003023 TaxID=3364675 RepID=UPI0036838ED8